MPETKKTLLDWSAVELFAMDVDGILTDGCIYLSSDGAEAKRFSIVDGLGLVRLRQAGIKLAWISGRESEATSRRAEELKIEYVVQGEEDKAKALNGLLKELGIDAKRAVYMGDDCIDAEVMRQAGIGVTVPEAQIEAIRAADYITNSTGGNGAVREVCNHILAASTQ